VLYPVKHLDHFRGNWNSHFSVLPHTTLVRDCFRTALQASVIRSQLFRLLNLSPVHPSYLLPTVLNMRWQIKPKTYGYEPSVTDASKPKKQMFGYTTYQHRRKTLGRSASSVVVHCDVVGPYW